MVTNRGCKRLRDLEKSAGVLVIKKDDINYYPDGEHIFDIGMPSMFFASIYNNKSHQYTDGAFDNFLICEKLSDVINNPKFVFVDVSIFEPEMPEHIKMALLTAGQTIRIYEIRPASEYPQDYTGWGLSKPVNVVDLDVECVYITDPSALVYYINGQPASETSPVPDPDIPPDHGPIINN